MYQDFEQRLSEYHDQWNDIASDDLTQHEQTTCYTHEHDDLAQEQNDDIRQLPFPNSLSAVIKKRTNVISSADYCDMMRQTNFGQRSLIKHCIARIHDPTMTPIQIFFTGPAGSGKTFTLRLLMETFNRFAQTHDAQRNVYVAAASTGKAAVAIGGTTVHNAFNISTMQRHGGLTFEALQLYRCAFSNIRVIFIDEISMIGAGIFHTINDRLKNIKMEHDYPFGEMDIIFCGDLRQLPPVSATPIYEPLKRGIHRSVLWQSLKYYPLKQVRENLSSNKRFTLNNNRR